MVVMIEMIDQLMTFAISAVAKLLVLQYLNIEFIVALFQEIGN